MITRSHWQIEPLDEFLARMKVDNHSSRVFYDDADPPIHDTLPGDEIIDQPGDSQ